MINRSTKVNVKDVPARDFIEAFAKHLKKGNKIKMPDVNFSLLFLFIIILFSGLASLRPHAPENWHPMIVIGSIHVLPQSLTNSISEERLVFPL